MGFCRYCQCHRRVGKGNPGRSARVGEEAESLRKPAEGQLSVAGVHGASSESQGWTCRGGLVYEGFSLLV